MKKFILGLIQGTATFLSWLGPKAASPLLQRLFLRPVPRPQHEREQGIMAQATVQRVRFDAEREIPLYTWGKSGPLVVLVHGWSGRGSQLSGYVAPLLATGFRVAAFDAPGHGLADGKEGAIPWWVRSLHLAKEHLGPIHAVLAHSLGTAAATRAQFEGLGAKALVYVAPPDNPGNYLYTAAEVLGFSAQAAALAHAEIEASFGVSMADYQARVLGPQMQAPLLVFHDEGDQEVLFSEGQALVSHWPNSELRSFHGLGHNRILREPAVLSGAVEFFLQALEPQAVK
jgi:pimeloyl-ACP methyl ester carboxylesterase